MADIIDQVATAMEDAGMEVTVMEPTVEAVKKFDVKSFIGGTVIGAAGAVLVRRAVKQITEAKDEIKVETSKVKAEKLRKKIDKLADQLDKLEAVDEPDEDPEEDEEEMVED